MHITLLDWIIIAVSLMIILGSGFYSSKLIKSVSDFLSANRCAGRYLMSISQGMTGLGAITLIAIFEKFHQAGFAAQWWTWMTLPVGLIFTLSGWLTYRYRETRALTMAQFFEIRYSKNFRIFSGILIWFSGMLNYGVFPGVTARFLISFGGFPMHFHLGGLRISTYLFIMIIMLVIALFLTLRGGQIAVMVSDFFQGIIVMFVLAVVVVILLYTFSWQDVYSSLTSTPPGASMVNPFDQSSDQIKDFNFFFFIMSLWIWMYTYRAWQGAQGYNSAAKSAHEARMAGIIGNWRGQVIMLSSMLIPIFAWILMNNANYAAEAAAVNATLEQFGDQQTRIQMLVPVALAKMLPIGMIGLFFVVILSAAISTDDSYIHSWGAVFVQDVLIPLRGKPFDTATHLKLLRWSIFFIGVASVIFSFYFPLRDYIYMYTAITGAIYTCGAGAVIVGGLYWKRGTAAGAWTAMIVSGVLALSGMLAITFWKNLSFLHRRFGEDCPFNGMHVTFYASFIAMGLYILISLITCRKPFDINAMLHRDSTKRPKRKISWRERFGITDEFTKFDKIIYFANTIWTFFWFAIFIVGTVIGLHLKTTNSQWLYFWVFVVIVSLIVSIGSVIWICWGGIRDLVDLMRLLSKEDRDHTDDGRV